MTHGHASGSLASFLGAWVAMTAVMMLPSAAHALWRYHRVARRASSTAVAGVAYLVVWTLAGAFAFVVERVVANATPLAIALIVLAAGAYQLSASKARQLARCRETPSDVHSPLRHGLRLGVDCVRACANLMAVMLVLGVMDLRAMLAAGVVIAAERLGAAGEQVARVVGGGVVATGLWLVARAG